MAQMHKILPALTVCFSLLAAPLQARPGAQGPEEDAHELAAQDVACRGVSTLVEITVAMELAVLWNRLRYSKIAAPA